MFGNLIMKNAVATKPVMALPTIIMLGVLGMTGAVSANGTSSQSDDSPTLQDALRNGKLAFNVRYRFENVDDDARPEEAHASTLRSRITYTTNNWNNLQVQLEVDDVTVIGGDNYDDLNNHMTNHAVVADPEGTEINQAWIAWSGLTDTTMKYGRQRINLDNQRFIGGVGWRQNEQTYDSFIITNQSLPDTTLFYGYINNVNRIFGPDDGRTGTPAADVDWESSADIININYRSLGIGTLSAYAYLLDLEDAPSASSKTYGVRLSGAQGKDTKWLYTAEYAWQSDYKDNPASYDADYCNLEAGIQTKWLTTRLGMDVLEADDHAGVAFSTPLATLHKFQGFADQFLNTPATGIEDRYGSVEGKVFGTLVQVTYHDFNAEEGNADYGDEIDIAIAKQVHKNVHLLLKYANYNADDFGTDTQKAWLQVTVAF